MSVGEWQMVPVPQPAPFAVPGAAMPVLRRGLAAQRHHGRRAGQVQADDNRHECRTEQDRFQLHLAVRRSTPHLETPRHRQKASGRTVHV